MRKLNSLVLAICMISCTANKNDVNVVDRNISEIESSTTQKDETSPVKTKFVWKIALVRNSLFTSIVMVPAL